MPLIDCVHVWHNDVSLYLFMYLLHVVTLILSYRHLVVYIYISRSSMDTENGMLVASGWEWGKWGFVVQWV